MLGLKQRLFVGFKSDPVQNTPTFSLNYKYHNLLYISTDFGVSWISKSLPGNYYWGAMSSASSGKMIAMSTYQDTQKSFYTLNYGASILDDARNARYGVANRISQDEKVIVFVDGLSSSGIRVSVDGGETWSSRGSSYNSNDVAISETGSVMYFADYNLGVYKSTDFGASRTKILDVKTLKVACSLDGRRVFAKSHLNTNRVYYSSDFGNTFSYATLSKNVASAGLHTDNSGQYVLLAGNTDCFLSSNYGVSFSDISNRLSGAVSIMASSNQYVHPSGQYIAIPNRASGNYKVFFSMDYGSTFIARNMPTTAYTPSGFAFS